MQQFNTGVQVQDTPISTTPSYNNTITNNTNQSYTQGGLWNIGAS